MRWPACHAKPPYDMLLYHTICCCWCCWPSPLPLCCLVTHHHLLSGLCTAPTAAGAAAAAAAGRTRITLRRTGELYSHVPPQAKVHNLVLGKTWVDSYGTFIVTNTLTGDVVQLEFKPCGWFGAGQYEFEGTVADSKVRLRRCVCLPACLLRNVS